VAGGHEQPVALPAAEAQLGAALRQADAADQLAVRRNHDDPVVRLAAVGRPLPAVMELPPVGKAGAVLHNVVDMDQPVRRGAPSMTGFGAKF
jgi:hypothetical protein